MRRGYASRLARICGACWTDGRSPRPRPAAPDRRIRRHGRRVRRRGGARGPEAELDRLLAVPRPSTTRGTTTGSRSILATAPPGSTPSMRGRTCSPPPRPRSSTAWHGSGTGTSCPRSTRCGPHAPWSSRSGCSGEPASGRWEPCCAPSPSTGRCCCTSTGPRRPRAPRTRTTRVSCWSCSRSASATTPRRTCERGHVPSRDGGTGGSTARWPSSGAVMTTPPSATSGPTACTTSTPSPPPSPPTRRSLRSSPGSSPASCSAPSPRNEIAAWAAAFAPPITTSGAGPPGTGGGSGGPGDRPVARSGAMAGDRPARHRCGPAVRTRLLLLRAAGQLPMVPPNVAGWPGGRRGAPRRPWSGGPAWRPRSPRPRRTRPCLAAAAGRPDDLAVALALPEAGVHVGHGGGARLGGRTASSPRPRPPQPGVHDLMNAPLGRIDRRRFLRLLAASGALTWSGCRSPDPSPGSVTGGDDGSPAPTVRPAATGRSTAAAPTTTPAPDDSRRDGRRRPGLGPRPTERRERRAEHGGPARPRYRDARPTLGVPEAELVGLTGVADHALHDALAPLVPWWDAGQLARAWRGAPAPDRSHFVSMDRWWHADGPAASGGWLGRVLDALPADDPLTAVALGGGAPVLRGVARAPVEVTDADRFGSTPPSTSTRSNG